MIAALRGVVLEKNLNDAVLDVNGVGYRVYFSLLSLARLPDEGQVAKVRVRTVVREDALDLYGSFRLAAHIEVLRREGHPIHTEMVKDGGREYARYHYRKDIHGTEKEIHPL